jgi:4'-phosphopantetheinyl transferase
MPELNPDGGQAVGERSSDPPAPPLEAGVCQVWWARPSDSRPAHDRLLEPTERARRARLVRPEDRDRLTVGTALARLVLAAHLHRPADRLPFDRTCPVCGADHGKPRLADGDLDVEALAAHVLAEDERPALDALTPSEQARALLTYWTRKEALLKATGDGLRVPMPTIAVSAPDGPPTVRRAPGGFDPGTPVSLHDLDPGSGHVAALAVLGLSAVQVLELDAGDLLASSPAPAPA